MRKEKESGTKCSACKKKIRNDVLLIAALLFTVTGVLILSFLLRKEGKTVTVSVDGQFFGEYLLGENRTVEIKGDGRYNILVIEDGCAYVKQASCPDGICSSHRPIRYGGESIICLPNKVVIEILSDSESAPDVTA